METSITVSPNAEKWGQEYTVFISDWDMEKAWDLFSIQERRSFERLKGGTMAQTMLALTMVVYVLEQDKLTKMKLSVGDE